jgi:hypothetical protein
MDFAAKMDEFARMPWHSKLPWIALMVLGFIVFWPIGLAILVYLLWSGRMACWRSEHAGRWYGPGDRMERGPGERMERNGPRGWWSHHHDRHHQRSSGNRAFDEYREETLRRLEDEQKEFFEFLERLRHAKDKAEFDQFMNDRGRRQPPPQGPEPQPQT